MPQFMVMIHEDEASEAARSPAEIGALLEGHAAYEQMLRGASAYVDGESLRPSAEGRRVSRRGGELRVEEGPFAGKALGGYYLLEAGTLDAAVALAQRCPVSPGTELDVRPVMKGRLAPGKASQQGQVLAFAVLGSAPSEEGWIEVMDRIDESARDSPPDERALGGVRLEAPGRGRRLASAAPGGRRAIFDGPFLESKEVIGGLFWRRMASLDEAVQWVGEKAFLQHGAVEIRALWRR